MVAGRLSENSEHKVLLIEAGGDPPIESEIPNLFFFLQNPNFTTNWGYYSEESDIASKSFEKGVHWPRGRMLGGSHGSFFFSHNDEYSYNFCNIFFRLQCNDLCAWQ